MHPMKKGHNTDFSQEVTFNSKWKENANLNHLTSRAKNLKLQAVIP